MEESDKEKKQKGMSGEKTSAEKDAGAQTPERGLLQRFLTFLSNLWNNWISLLGAVIATVSGCTIALALAAQLVSPTPTKPYSDALAFLVMPAVFMFGLMLIPVGLLLERRRKARRPLDSIQVAFKAAIRDKTARRRIIFVGLATFMNIIIIGAAGHRALVFMDSNDFCGKLCHSVMQPEYDTYLRSPHSRVPCVNCHIGQGASWAVKSKISGLRQIWAMLTGSANRPIPSPVKELRPARDTCEQCHWPAKFHGNRVAFTTHYRDDEKNTSEITALLLKVGGEDPRTKEYHGIHWHVSPDIEVRYQAHDQAREKIGKVVVKEKGKLKAEYLPQSDLPKAVEERLMDCVDCHNRPTHIFDQTPVLAVNRAFTQGRLDASIPFLHKVAVELISRDDLGRDEAKTFFRKGIVEKYAKQYPEVKLSSERVEATAQALADLYHRNVYPGMKIGWDNYPSHLGHRGAEEDRRGCFRCHNDEHETKDGKTLSMDCDLCHQILHEGEKPETLPEFLRTLLSVSN